MRDDIDFVIPFVLGTTFPDRKPFWISQLHSDGQSGKSDALKCVLRVARLE